MNTVQVRTKSYCLQLGVLTTVYTASDQLSVDASATDCHELLYYKFPNQCDSERILKIGQYLMQFCVEYCGLLFWPTL